MTDARVRHAGSQSAPTSFRAFVAHWREPWFNRRWEGPVAALEAGSPLPIDHPCGDWRQVRLDQVATAAAAEATRMVVPLARAEAAVGQELRSHAVNLEVAWAERSARAAALEPLLAEAGARVRDLERAVAVAEDERDRARRRSRRLRRRLKQLEASPTAFPPSAVPAPGQVERMDAWRLRRDPSATCRQ